MTIKPLGDRILLSQLEAESKTKSGIILPETSKEKPQQGKVIAVGNGKIKDGKRIPLEVKKGDKVLFAKYDTEEISVDGKQYLILKEKDVLAIIN